jgi:uncharacterized SAM-binding protein YcdF (DUF218 family)
MIKKLILSILILIFINLGNFLDITNTISKSDIIVVLGGGKDARIKKGLILYKQNYSKSNKIIFTGSNKYDMVLPIFYRYDYLVKNGVKSSNIIHIDETVISNTMDELIAVKKYLLQNNMKSVLFVSHPTHSRRIKILANLIADYDINNIKISFASADHTYVWDKQKYFFNLISIKLVFLEILKIPYNLIKYYIFL